jgi:hypothetical protein
VPLGSKIYQQPLLLCFLAFIAVDLCTVIDQSRVEGLSLNQRDFLHPPWSIRALRRRSKGPQLSTRGGFAQHAKWGREEFTNFLLDSMDNNGRVNR